MPFAKRGAIPLDARANLRLTSVELAQLREDADMAGLGVSELVRRRYFGRPIIANVDEVMIRELRRIGGLLKHVHNTSGGVYDDAVRSTLKEIKVCIERIAK